MKYQIGDFSKITQLNIKTLRYYHEYGLLTPSSIDNLTGYRYYDEECFEKVKTIMSLKELDFSLKEIKEILENYKDDAEIINMVIKKKDDLSKKITRYKLIGKKLENFLKKENEISKNKYENKIILKEIPDLTVASIRFKGKYQDIGNYFLKLGKSCGRYITGTFFSLYYDGEYKENDADIEACVPIKQTIDIEGINYRTLKGGEAVTLIYRGSYENFGDSYKKIIDYITTSKIKTALPAREIYIKGPGIIFKGNPNNYITEIQYLLN